MERIAQAIEGFIFEALLFGQPEELTRDMSLLERRIVDSTGILELVRFVEEEFAVHVEDRDLVPDNFDSINRLAAFVARRTRAAA